MTLAENRYGTGYWSAAPAGAAPIVSAVATTAAAALRLPFANRMSIPRGHARACCERRTPRYPAWGMATPSLAHRPNNIRRGARARIRRMGTPVLRDWHSAGDAEVERVRILVVEDEDKLARLLARGLAEEGYAVDVT